MANLLQPQNVYWHWYSSTHHYFGTSVSLRPYWLFLVAWLFKLRYISRVLGRAMREVDSLDTELPCQDLQLAGHLKVRAD